MTKTMLMYKNVTALSRTEHKSLKITPADGLTAASGTHFMPLAGVEFYAASQHYPIVFISEGSEPNQIITPIALLGLETGINDFVSKDLAWKSHTYVPAFARRYPFVIATTDDKSEEFTLCFDADYPGFNKEEGKALFNEDGSNSEFLEETIHFINGFNSEMGRTRELVDVLNEFELLEKRSADISNSIGEVFQVQDFLVVSEEKLANLTGEQLSRLNKMGYLMWIYAHLISLQNFPALLDVHLQGK